MLVEVALEAKHPTRARAVCAYVDMFDAMLALKPRLTGDLIERGVTADEFGMIHGAVENIRRGRLKRKRRHAKRTHGRKHGRPEMTVREIRARTLFLGVGVDG